MIQILKISDFLIYQGKNTENTEQNQAFIADLSLTGANVIELSFLPDCSLKRYKKIATVFLCIYEYYMVCAKLYTGSYPTMMKVKIKV